jgi:hypothetical protein
MNIEHGTADWLIRILPAAAPIVRRCEADNYGASHVIATTLDKINVPISLATWTHGASFWNKNEHVRQIVHHCNRIDRCLVNTKEQESFLRKRGFLRVHAVGAPVLYVEDKACDRVSNSLLVMPGHSLFNSNHDFDYEKYCDYICSIRKKFDVIVACVHVNDVKNNSWPRVFDRYKIPWVLGANAHDANSLLRMSRIFRTFEYMTTNSFGSHIAYAAYFGAKASISGEIYKYDLEDYKDVPWYEKNRKVMLYEKASVDRYINGPRKPDFLIDPTNATKQIEFGRRVLGYNSRRSPEELASLLGWSTAGQNEILIKKLLAYPFMIGKKSYHSLRRQVY